MPPMHISGTLDEHLSKDVDDGVVLDLACGDGKYSSVLEELGYRWIGLDIISPDATVWGDAHRLPIPDDSVDVVLGIFALEHFHDPKTATREVARVLKPGGRFLGTVAFLEDFHGQSYYHHTANGTRTTLEEGGLDVELVEPFDNLHASRWLRWDGMVPMARGLFPGAPRWLRFALVAPVYTLHRLWYAVGRRVVDSEVASEEYRRKRLAGQFLFVADASE